MKRLVMVLMLTTAALFATSTQDNQGTARSGMPMQMPMMVNCPMTLQGKDMMQGMMEGMGKPRMNPQPK